MRLCTPASSTATTIWSSGSDEPTIPAVMMPEKKSELVNAIYVFALPVRRGARREMASRGESMTAPSMI